MTNRTPTGDDDLSPSPSPNLLFLPPTPSTSDESPSPSPSPSNEAPWSDPDDSGAYESGPVESSATPSPDKAPARPRIAALRATLRKAVRTAGGLANVAVPRLVTRNPAETVHGVWLPDSEDEAAIAEPLARMASRRTPAAVTENPDLVDLAALALALVDYLRKSLSSRAQVTPEAYVEGTVEPEPAEPAEPVSDEPYGPVTVVPAPNAFVSPDTQSFV